MSNKVKDNEKKKGILRLLRESIAKSNDGCGPGCGCHSADEKKPQEKETAGGKKGK